MFETLRQQLNTLVRRKKRKAKGVGSLRELFPEASDLDLKRISEVTQFTMTSPERLWALRRATQYVLARNIPGDFAEAGVWRGGSSMMSALSLKDCGDEDRTLWLYDTYEGMPAPSEADVELSSGASASRRLDEDPAIRCIASLDDVQANMASTGYAAERIRYVIGKTQETLADPANRPQRIALLRLDTDWYESTRAELENLFDLLSPGGVLIVDDYGHWAGSMRAVDEFFAARPQKYLLNRIDYTGRLLVKL